MLQSDFSTYRSQYIEPDYYLSPKYRETFIVLMIQDPLNIFAYWEIAQTLIDDTNLALRLFWPDHKEIIVINENSDSCYISVEKRGLPLFGELGQLLKDGTFITLAVSNNLQKYLSFQHHNLNNHLQRTLDNWQPGVSS